MIYIFNIIISIFCLIPIVFYFQNFNFVSNNHFKSHFIIFILKLSFISMFIYIFIYNFSISNPKIFIVSGCFNFILFHFIEGFVSQKKMNTNELK